MIAALLLATVATTPSLDLRVDGEGYLRLAYDGRIVYAKSARFVARGGRLVTEKGAGLMPMIATPTGAVAFEAEVTAFRVPSRRPVVANFHRYLLHVRPIDADEIDVARRPFAFAIHKRDFCSVGAPARLPQKAVARVERGHFARAQRDDAQRAVA